MEFTFENVLLVVSILLFVSLIGGKTSYRFGVPVLIFFLAVGMIAGSEGIGGIEFDSPKVAQGMGIIGLNFILFSGGLDTNWKSIKPVLWQGISLSTLGVLLTAFFMGAFIWWITNFIEGLRSFSIYESLLLGSIISSTDSASVFSILRSKNLSLKGHLRPLLELESGSNDPMAYVLTITFITLITTPEMSAWGAIPIFLRQIILGVIFGFLMGWIGKKIINKIKLNYEGMYPVLMIGIMLFTFAFTDFIKGNGFLAIYLAAVYLGNQDIIHKQQIIKWFDGFAWLMQILLFVTLGLLVFPSHLIGIAGIALLISLFLMFIARPLSVFIGISFFKMSMRVRWFISWVGLRGAVPIVFATYPMIAGLDIADDIFNIVFFVSLTSLFLQGTTLASVAKWMGLQEKDVQNAAIPLTILENEKIRSKLTEITLTHDSFAINRRIVDLEIPKDILIALIYRGGEYLVPNGSTELMEGDQLFLISGDQKAINRAFYDSSDEDE
ncbi:MAG: potassium/proton antiporter [Bacteroidales bacterium]|jgi:cell volume regulation protein A|nr:potassium/proton antiporter [Bacteroidales bacterium]